MVTLSSMFGKTKERWLELCDQAANEQDAAKLKALIEDIARLLKEKDDRLKGKPPEKVKLPARSRHESR